MADRHPEFVEELTGRIEAWRRTAEGRGQSRCAAAKL